MKHLKKIICLGGLGLLMGCASKPPEEVIQLPITTPFDANSFQRHAYLEGYKEGYKSAEHGGDFAPPYERGPYPLARELGWRAGAVAASNAQPDSAKVKQ